MSTLRQNLTTLHGTGLILNIVLGGGLLALPGLVLQQVGSHGLWAWLLCAISALPLLLVSIVMGSNFPNAGGVAHFSGMAFGKAGHMVTSILLLGAAVFGLPSIALTGGYYLAEILPVNPVFTACAILLISSLLNLVSPKIVRVVSSVIAGGIFVCLVGLIGLGLSVVDWTQVPANTPMGSDLRWELIIAPYMMIFFAFTGWEVAASLSEEFRHPKRDFPRAMGLSFLIACILYLVMGFTIQNVAISSSYEASFVSIASIAFGEWGEVAIVTLAVAIIFANMMGAVWAVSRLVFSLSRAGYLPMRLRANSAGTPISSIIITSSVLMTVLLLSLLELIHIDQMLAIAGQNFLLIFAIISLALFRLIRGFFSRGVAVVSLMLVATLMAISGFSLLYPAGLIVSGLVLARISNPKPEQA